jgi:hypothetical protein
MYKFFLRKKDIVAKKEYQNVKELIKKFDPNTQKDPEWKLEYVHNKFELMKNYVEYLDEKADSLVKYATIGTALIGLMLGVINSSLRSWGLYTIFAGLGLWIISIIIAISVRTPYDTPYPPSIRKIYEYETKYSEQPIVKARLVLGYACAIVGQKIIGRFKAKRLQVAYYILALALSFVVLSFFSIFI